MFRHLGDKRRNATGRAQGSRILVAPLLWAPSQDRGLSPVVPVWCGWLLKRNESNINSRERASRLADREHPRRSRRWLALLPEPLIGSCFVAARARPRNHCRGTSGWLCNRVSSARCSRLLKLSTADQVLVREMGTKFIVGFCGANLHVVRLERRTKGNVWKPKSALWLRSPPLSATWLQSNCPITGNNCFLAFWEVKKFIQ